MQSEQQKQESHVKLFERYVLYYLALANTNEVQVFKKNEDFANAINSVAKCM
jgi:hypothetical protein